MSFNADEYFANVLQLRAPTHFDFFSIDFNEEFAALDGYIKTSLLHTSYVYMVLKKDYEVFRIVFSCFYFDLIE